RYLLVLHVEGVDDALPAGPDIAGSASGADDIERLVIGREAEAVGVRQLRLGDGDIQLGARIPAIDVGREFASLPAERAGIRRADQRVELALGIGRAARIIGMPFVQAAAIRRVGEPDRAVGMRHDVVRRVERLTVKGIRNHGHRAVMLPAHNAPEKILAGELPALMVEGIAVRVVGRPAERRDPPILPDIAVLNVTGYVAEDEILPLARPSRAFGPIGAGPYPADRRIPQ